MDKLKIGVLGCANVALKHMIPAIKEVDCFELVAVASRTKAKAEAFAAQFSCDAVEGYENVLERDDINVVYIPLPTGLHEEWIMKSLEKGKHVLAEKSLAVDYNSARKIVNKAGSLKLLVMEDFMFQYHRQHTFVKKLIADGEIGDVHFFKSSFGFPPRNKGDIRYDKELGGGALLDAGGYVVKAVQLFLGPDLKLGSAFLKYDEQTGVDIYGGAIMKSNKDQIASVSFSFDNYYQCNYEIWGTKGKITSERAFTAPPNFPPVILFEKQDHKQEFIIKPENHFINILKEFYQAILKNDYQRFLEEALLQAKLLDQIRTYSESSD